MNYTAGSTDFIFSDDKGFPIYIGYDPREEEAWDVCAYSIRKHATIPVQIIKLDQKPLREANIYTRKDQAATSFSLTRFLVPHLQKYKGFAAFMDCDMLWTVDIKQLVDLCDDAYAVRCVKHDYISRVATKMDGQKNENYPRKNWSSLILFNCGHSYMKVMSPTIVNKESPAYLHRFSAFHDQYIGPLPQTMNFLVGEYDKLPNGQLPKNIHYTLGGPWFEDRPECVNCDYNEVYKQYLKEYMAVEAGEATPFFSEIQSPPQQKPRLTIKELSMINLAKKTGVECVPCKKRSKKKKR